MNSFSSKHLIIFAILSLTFALGSSLYISEKQGRFFSNDLRNREISLLFGAIEAGPLAIARLNSSAFSQEAIDRLMQNPSLKGRAITSASIYGGPDGNYQYAKWEDGKSVSKECLANVVKNFSYPDSLNSFQVTIEYDKCSLLIEEKQIYKISLIATSLVFLLVTIALILAIFPIVTSLRLASSFLTRPKEKSDVEKIKFLPLRHMTKLALKSFELERDAVLAQLSRQVAHDIRSPLSALKMALKDIDTIPNDYQAMIRNSIQRISGIANNLLQTNLNIQEKSLQAEEEVLYLALDTIITEKKILFRDRPDLTIEFSFKADRFLFVSINKIEFHRVLSNLINNSAEAMVAGIQKIKVEVERIDQSIQIKIIDNGKGIPASILEKIGSRGFSYGKNNNESGSGLGIFHAKNTIESFGGNFTIQSKEAVGTEITIRLPIVKNPITDNHFYDYAYIEDDNLIRLAWKKRAEKQNIKLILLKSTAEFMQYESQFSKELTKIYIDSDLGERERGEDFAIVLHSLGYQNIYMSTGYDANHFAHIPWLKVTPKECPF